MATASQGNLTLDLGGLERALAKASRITDQGMRDMQQRIEEAGKKAAAALSAQAASALQVTSGSFSDFQKSYDPAADAAENFIHKNNQLALLLKQNKSNQDSYTQSLVDGGKALDSYSADVDKLRNAGALAANAVGMGSRKAALAKELAGYDEQYALDRKALDAKFPNGDPAPTYADKLGIKFPVGDAYGNGAGQSDSYASQLDALKTKHDQMTQQVQDNYQAMSDAQGSWLNGASSAWDDYAEKSGDVAAKSREVFTRAFESMGDALSTFATTGKFSFSDFAKSVLSDMAKLAAQTAMSSGLSSLFGLVSSAVGSFWGSGTPAPTTTSVNGISNTFTPQLNPGAISYSPPSGTLRFADGGAFTNTIATSPTLAPMALFGEAGPEAIMPLSRGADGSLGVRAVDGGATGSTSSNQVVIQQTINVGDAQGSNDGGEMNTQAVAQAYAGAARQGAAEQIARDLKPGGQIWSAINGR
ncbi:phage tail tape measure protein [Pseudomonas gingeri NCPPB 3146 = LMG 5327]|uniref:Phage tail tape measure protein n=3 Tax=Pseudomonas TaxID=286 RepID=A0A7Y7XZ55_9PSED|nr:phage tail tape measure protein [Pseudomonas gingeri]NWC14882.1 phage tail tape measure protein [Pseudomonas gingeri]PNQ91045.1 phage tail tape measure protein [Pseudomonas gingeri NCPPB 3146 = LMG 5327]